MECYYRKKKISARIRPVNQNVGFFARIKKSLNRTISVGTSRLMICQALEQERRKTCPTAGLTLIGSGATLHSQVSVPKHKKKQKLREI